MKPLRWAAPALGLGALALLSGCAVDTAYVDPYYSPYPTTSVVYYDGYPYPYYHRPYYYHHYYSHAYSHHYGGAYHHAGAYHHSGGGGGYHHHH
ncbi:MAG TPA: hypothetical protein VIM58_08600 [Candidatus Methylacidiphilales bacterium]